VNAVDRRPESFVVPCQARIAGPARLRLLIAVPILGLLLGGCPSTRTAPATTAGFLGDYTQLRPHPDDPNVLVYRNRVGVLGEYDRFLVEPVLIYLHPESPGAGIDPGELQELATDLRDAVVGQLEEGGYELADEAGPGVLVVRAALTNVVPVNVAANVGTKLAGAVAGVGLLSPRLDLGQASIEAEMLDGDSGERVAAYVAGSRGRRYSSAIQGAKRWGDVRAAFRGWAELLRLRIDAARAARAPSDGA
jgi:hypothetical protein